MNPIVNKYSKWYNQLIELRRNRQPTGYVEAHHIIPKSLGGSNSEDNLILLYPKEHFIAHLLLTKMYAFDNHRRQKIIIKKQQLKRWILKIYYQKRKKKCFKK